MFSKLETVQPTTVLHSLTEVFSSLTNSMNDQDSCPEEVYHKPHQTVFAVLPLHRDVLLIQLWAIS